MRKLVVILVVGLLFAGGASAALVAHWTFDVDGSDSSGNNYHATLHNDAAINSTGGILGGGSLDLDGVNDFASTHDGAQTSTYNGITGSNARSISAWVKAAGGASEAALNDIFVGWGGVDLTGQNRYDFGLGNSTDEQLRSELNAGAAQSGVAAANAIDLRDGSWHHVALSYSSASTSVDLYVNGKLYQSASYGTTPNTTDVDLGLYIGTGVREGSGTNGLELQSDYNGNADRFFQGSIDDVGIWDSNIGATDVALVNALGRIGPNNLANLDAATGLWGAGVGDTALINGVEWEKVSGLDGDLGDWQQDGGDNGVGSFVVLDGSGGGLQVIPEPTSIGLIGLFGLLFWIHRKFTDK